MKSCWILEDEVRNLSIYNWQNNLLSCRNTAILCKLCFTAPKQWKVIKPDEVHSASWGRWCLQAVAEARKLIPLNFSQHWKTHRKQDKRGKAEKRKAQPEKHKMVGKTEDYGVHFTGTEFELWGPDKVKKNTWLWADRLQKSKLSFLATTSLTHVTSEIHTVSFHQHCDHIYPAGATSLSLI